MRTNMSNVEKIPKIIHQIWLGPLDPPLEAMESWKNLQPVWEYILWTEKNLPELKNQDAFDKSERYAQKADILRYEILFHHGGFFVDADEQCIKNVTPLFDNIYKNDFDCFASYEKENSTLVANGIMGCTKNNAFMKKMVDEINIDQDGYPWEIVGPGYLTRMIEKYKPAIYLFEPKVFLPIHYSDKHLRKIDLALLAQDPDIYGVQFWGSTTRAYRAKFKDSPSLFFQYWMNRFKGKRFTIKKN